MSGDSSFREKACRQPLDPDQRPHHLSFPLDLRPSNGGSLIFLAIMARPGTAKRHLPHAAAHPVHSSTVSRGLHQAATPPARKEPGFRATAHGHPGGTVPWGPRPWALPGAELHPRISSFQAPAVLTRPCDSECPQTLPNARPSEKQRLQKALRDTVTQPGRSGSGRGSDPGARTPGARRASTAACGEPRSGCRLAPPSRAANQVMKQPVPGSHAERAWKSREQRWRWVAR